MAEKTWGGEPFWGLGYDWDPDWFLTERQKELRAQADRALRAGDAREREALRRRAALPAPQLRDPRRERLPGAHRPEEYGGLGENHVAYTMVCETLARYGCASTAMCYVMHSARCTIMLRPTPELIDKYIRPLNSGKIGTLSYSDPETGSHFWYPFSSGADAQTAATGSRRRRPGRRRPGSPTSTSCRPRARTSRATTTCRSS